MDDPTKNVKRLRVQPANLGLLDPSPFQEVDLQPGSSVDTQRQGGCTGFTGS